jgi:conjugative transfer signal peptidase TraF
MQVNYNKWISYTLPALMLIISVIFLGLIIFVSKHLLRNITTSEPLGWYWLSSPDPVQVGKIYTIKVPADFLLLVKQLGYKSNAKALFKKVVAKDGDIIKVTEDGILINDKLMPNSQSIEVFKGILLHPLPIGHKRKLKDNEYFVLGETKNSFDSRYFGVVNGVDIKNEAYLILRDL